MAYCAGFLELAVWGLKTDQIILDIGSICILGRKENVGS